MTQWNGLAWNDLTMERSDLIPIRSLRREGVGQGKCPYLYWGVRVNGSCYLGQNNPF